MEIMLTLGVLGEMDGRMGFRRERLTSHRA